ncbi:MAG: hypothetical protein ACRERS_10795, partial [Methylococcales bacterium]
RLIHAPLGAAVTVALFISMPWYVAMIVLHGSLFSDFYLHEHVSKFEAVPHFILNVWLGLLLYMLPWTVYTLYSVYRIFHRGLYRDWNYKLLLIVTGLFLLVLMIPNQKGLYYSIPLLPYCGLMTGAILGGPLAPGKTVHVLTASILIIAGLIFAAAIGLLGAAMAFSAIACVLAIGAAIFILRAKKTTAMILAGLSLAPLYTHIFPSINFEIIPIEKTLEIAAGKSIYSYRISPLKFSNALGTDVHELLEPEDLRQPLASAGLVIITEEDYQLLDRVTRARTKILLEWKRWRRRIPYEKFFGAILTGAPEQLHQQVLLISK